MSTEFTYDIIAHPDEGYIRVKAEGSIDLDSLKQMYASVLTSPMYSSGMNRLWDFTLLDASRLTAGDLESFAVFMSRGNLGQDTVNAAILTTKDLEFGMVRMLLGMGNGVFTPNVIVTRNRGEALAWVRSEGTKDIDPKRE